MKFSFFTTPVLLHPYSVYTKPKMATGILKVEGDKVVGNDGKPIILRGSALGGWYDVPHEYRETHADFTQDEHGEVQHLHVGDEVDKSNDMSPSASLRDTQDTNPNTEHRC